MDYTLAGIPSPHLAIFLDRKAHHASHGCTNTVYKEPVFEALTYEIALAHLVQIGYPESIKDLKVCKFNLLSAFFLCICRSGGVS